MKSLPEQIEALIEPTVTSMGFNLVQVKMTDGKAQTLQIMAEKPNGTISLNDCAAISRQLSAVLDVEDIIPGEYRLEVGSPGIDRPLVKPADYVAYIGHAAKIETQLPVNGRKRFSGALKAVEADAVVITVDGKDHALPFVDIQAAKLLLTDALIKAHQKRSAS